MGQLISLTDRRAERAQHRVAGGFGGCAFFFALDCPVAYLLAERIERELGEVAWMPTLAASARGAEAADRMGRARREAQLRRLPLIEPDSFPFDARPVTRAAAFAARQGAGGAFALAAMRMAFAGGFDLEDPDVIAEVAAAAGVDIGGALAAAGTAAVDAGLGLAGRGLTARGIGETPALCVGGGWHIGYGALWQPTLAAEAAHMLGLPGRRR